MKKHITFLILATFLISLLSLYGCSGTKPSSVSKNSLDPFEGLVVEFNGVSPFCTISFNNARCREEVQMNVEYSLDPNTIVLDKTFEIDETCTVYALLKNPYAEDQKYTLSQTSKEYVVKDVPSYITEITDDMDLSHLKTEIKDYLDSITAFSVGNDAMGVHKYYSHTSPTLENIYFSALKLNTYNKFNNEFDYFNKIDILYSTTITSKGNFFGDDDGEYNRYFAITAKNIVQYPDGKIGWGKDDPYALSFENNVNSENMESLINSNITSIKTDYNVSQITELLK